MSIDATEDTAARRLAATGTRQTLPVTSLAPSKSAIYDLTLPHPSSLEGGCRSRLRVASRFLARSRASEALRVGLVGRRGGGGGFSAARIVCSNRSIASARLRAWLRSSEATIRSLPSLSRRDRSRRLARPFSAVVNVGLRSRSKVSSTRVEEVLTC